MVLTGVDVHDKRGAVKWDRVANAGHSFAFVRAAYGDKPDTRVKKNFDGARAAGLLCGVYHFYRQPKSAAKQADLMCKVLKDIGYGAGALPPVLDVEDNPAFDGPWKKSYNADYVAGLKMWIDRVSAAFACTPVIYTRAGFWTQIGNPVGFDKYPLWVAHYTKNAEPRLPASWSSYAFWQFTEGGDVEGIAGPADVNRFAGTKAALKKLALK